MSNELSAGEIELQRYRIQDMLQQAQVKVWNNRRFPNAHVPDVAFLKDNILIGEAPDFSFTFHPELRPELLAMHEESVAKQDSVDAIKKVAWYEPANRSLIFFPQVLVLPDEELRRVVYHEAATDIVGKQEEIQPEQYTEEQTQIVSQALSEVFPENINKPVERTTIVKLGFREMLYVEGYPAADLTHPDLMIIEEIYPTTSEIITDQILRRNGDIRSFDKDAIDGKLRLPGPYLDSNEEFAKVLFVAMRFVDWRDILTAYGIRDISGTLEHIRQSAKDPNIAGGIFVELFDSMKRDEERIYALNSMGGLFLE